MRELALQVPIDAAEEVLDRLLPLAPYGVHEVARDGEVELRVRGAVAELPSAAAVSAAAAGHPHSLREREVPDDWRARRLLDYQPLVIAERLVVRPDWAPPAPAGLLDVVLEERDAFGNGGHPTTWACLEELCGIEPGGSLADLGCGSGVLGITAALLGFAPLVAIDREPSAVDATRANAERNGAQVEARVADLTADPLPAARTVVANVPPEIHAVIAGRLPDDTETVMASGVLAGAADDVVARYAAHGFAEARRRECGGWVVLVLSRPDAR